MARTCGGPLALALAAVGALAAGGAAQSPLRDPIPIDPVAPKGYLGLDFVTRYGTWDSRYGPGGEVRPLGADLTRADASSLFPGIATLEDNLRRLAGSTTDFPSVLGPVAGRVSKQVTRLEFGARVGVLHWLTLGVMVPLVRAQAPVDVAFRPDTLNGDLGLNPFSTGDPGVTALGTELAGAVSAAQARATSLCDASPTSTACTDATALAQEVASFTSETAGAYGASPFFPLEGTAAAVALTDALAALNQDLVAAGLAAVQATFVFPTDRVDASAFAQIPADPGGAIRGSALEPVDGFWQPGDIEVSATARLLDGEVRDSGASEPRLAWELAGTALARLGTGRPANPDIFFDTGSGDGQTDFEGRMYAALRVGGHLEVRSTARYGIQQSTTQIRRVAPPTLVLAPWASRTLVRWSPASYFGVQVSPRLHLTDQLSVAFDYDYFTKGEDTYALADPSAPGASGLDASVLAQGSGMTVQQAGFGLTYATIRTWRGGRAGTPLELNARLVRTVRATGGLTPKLTRFEMGVHVFHRLWGGS